MTGPTATTTLLATTDLHGQVRHFDYAADAPYADALGHGIGLAKVASVVDGVRAETSVAMVLDAGDLLQGGALDAADSARVAGTEQPTHPVAAAMNLIGYDAVALGNHDLDDGVDALQAFARQLEAPILAGNVRAEPTGERLLGAVLLRDVVVEAARPPVRVGVVGLTTAARVVVAHAAERGLRIDDPVAEAPALVDEARDRGADVVVVLIHSGVEHDDAEAAAGENVALRLAREVAGVDVVVAGHSHVEVAERRVVQPGTGREVLVTQPLCWGMRVGRVDVGLRYGSDRRWHLVSARSTLLDTAAVPEYPDVVEAVAAEHVGARRRGAEVVGQVARTIDAVEARYRPSASVDLLAHAAADGVRRPLRDVGLDHLPLLCATAPPSRTAVLPAGAVLRRHVDALCPHDHRPVAVLVDGRRLREHLEQAAGFFAATSSAGPHHPDTLTNAPGPDRPAGRADFDLDVVHGLDAALTYDLDLARPLGQRVVSVRHGGTEVGDAQCFVLVTTRYRLRGAGAYPVTGAEVVAEASEGLRNLVVARLRRGHDLGPATDHWRLLHRGSPLVVDDGAYGSECAEVRA
ncbi:2',3'-cyclic-nucleotide 2'-phosphodiesterase/3'-nucleotidase [Mumia flava]|uniref:2',3'-cyclic-nucleotide 2'-phosphodiesterase/3'-nucleotidase n=1 Tax=Mumia flava TaxID=1348852 RepID=A0A2M9BJI5_9ACTN|nr:metallophosphoesterase [Mumia flava]PJJ58092.1 2',3'-cyclic-nucleotide 2'-phosphodiesterase/3'-nucleotidase [Mumia flava]